MKLSQLEQQYLMLTDGSISLQDFEQWLYQHDETEHNMDPDAYFELVNINYNDKYGRHELDQKISTHISLRKLETHRLLRALNAIISREEHAGAAFIYCYERYCKGYTFLRAIGLEMGLCVYYPEPAYQSETFDGLHKSMQKKLLNSLYPQATELAKEVKNWLMNEQIILKGEQEKELGNWLYEDKR